MNFLRTLLQAGKKDGLADSKSQNKASISKKNVLFALNVDAFFPANRWKMSKKIIGTLIIAVFFQFVGFSIPVLAQEAIVASVDKELVVLSNGAVLNKLESEFAQKALIILEKEPISTEKISAVVIAGTEQIDPPHITSAALPAGGQFVSWGVRTITAYNSEVGQTDDSPCVTANGFNVCEHGLEDTIAANFLKFGAKVTIPDLFGDRIFVVRDRMNERHADRVDVWMVNKTDAKSFGVRRVEIKVMVE